MIFFLGWCLLAFASFAQKPKAYTSSELLHEMEKLGVLGTVMYVAAHPDDENTRLIAYLANEKKVETIYLSVTRGDGGQNLIGPEIREGLGLIRTQELLAARRTDGGRQYFTRANDFGYSKHPDEALSTWDKQKVLADVVWAFRKFRPDVIINRFDTQPGTTHGHHTASAMLSLEAFELAADPTAFPEQLSYVEPWQPKRIFWNTYNWANVDTDYEENPEVISYPVSTYNPLLGKSYTEIAAESRTMHKSQGFGSTGTRGEAKDYLIQLKGDLADKDIFSGMDLSWSRIPGGAEIQADVEALLSNFRAHDPQASVSALLNLRQKMAALGSKDPLVKRKIAQVEEIIRGALGLYMEAVVSSPTVVPGEDFSVSMELTNRSGLPLKVISAGLEDLQLQNQQKNVAPGEQLELRLEGAMPNDKGTTGPYWLRQAGTVGMYEVGQQALIGLPETPPALLASLHVEVEGVRLSYTMPVVHKRNDPVDGEVYRPFTVIPPVMVNLSDPVLIFSSSQSKSLTVTLKAGKDKVEGELRIPAPQGWSVEPAVQRFALEQKDEQASFTFTLSPPNGDSDVQVKAVARVDGIDYDAGIKIIDYPHIPLQTMFPPAEARAVRIQVEKRGVNIGFIEGAGDEMPTALRQLGYQVEIINPSGISAEMLANYDAVVIGVRAYNTVGELRFAQEELLKYVEQGGVMLVQYNTNSRLVTDQLGPYDFRLSRDRVTVEEAPVRILAPDHPVMNYPNAISPRDFEGWVQERGLYFPGSWDEAYVPVLGATDPGEEELQGGLLVARHGKGWYIYTGYSFFRQLPAGVPGAFRILANMVSLGAYDEESR